VKTTIELPDELYRRAKVAAAARGRTLKELVEEGLELALDATAAARARPALGELMREACGVVDSGIADLGSNPAHLAGFGRDPPGDR
jgi:hypothetical protein